MHRTLGLIGAIALLTFVAPAYADGPYKLDAKGKCHDAKGHFTKVEMCKAAPAPNRCRDIKTKKFAKCGAPNTEPLPMGK